MKHFKIGYILRDNGACGYYRLTLPLTALQRYAGCEVLKIERGDKADKILQYLQKSDVIIVPRVGEEMFVEYIPRIKGLGKKIIIDHDDNMFCISPMSPHYEEAGTENVQVCVNGEMLPLWEDGKNIDLARNRARCVNFKKAMNAADMVTVTQPILADVYREYNPKVKVLPNCVDMKLWQRLSLQPHDGIRIGWLGGSSHYEDWLMISPAITEIMNRYSQTRLILMGAKFDGTLKGIPRNRIEFHEWVHTEAYPLKAAILDLDMAIIPLQDTEFNRCKSNIKWVEMGALQIPCVTSFVSPYKESATEENGIYIKDNDVGAWCDGLDLLIKDPLLRARMGAEAHKTVGMHFDINTKWHLWHDAYQELMT